MALRWCAAGMVEASKQFRRVNGHLHLAALQVSLERHVAAQTARADCNTQGMSAA
jgi:putative transposase